MMLLKYKIFAYKFDIFTITNYKYVKYKTKYYRELANKNLISIQNLTF